MTRVLIVDDNPGILKITEIKLRRCGYETIVSESGAEAIDLIRQERPNYLLLDLVMLGTSGLDVLDHLRSFSKIPVIAFTAKPDLAKTALERGAADVIHKPFDPDKLI
jgi:DNA-binding response OmpR family regulator